MIKTKFIKISALALVLSVTVAGAPALAHQGRASAETETSTTTATTTEEDTTAGTEVRKRGQAMAEDMRKQHASTAKAKTAEQRKTTCEAHKQGLTKKFERIVANSEKIKTHIDSIMTKAQDFQTANNLTVADYDTLVTSATTAQTAATDSIAALKEVTPSLDCNNTSVATDVATFKAAAQDTRDTLKDYRKAVKAILKALHQAKSTNDSDSSEGGTQ